MCYMLSNQVTKVIAQKSALCIQVEDKFVKVALRVVLCKLVFDVHENAEYCVQCTC